MDIQTCQTMAIPPLDLWPGELKCQGHEKVRSRSDDTWLADMYTPWSMCGPIMASLTPTLQFFRYTIARTS